MSVIEVAAPDDEVEDLMDAVGSALEAWEGQTHRPDPNAPRVPDAGDLRNRAAVLRHQWRVDTNAVIHSNRPRLGPWLIRMQTLVRRTTWWFLEPVIQQIRQFQRNSSHLIEDLARQQSTTVDRVSELEAKLAVLEGLLDVGSAPDADET